MHRGELRSTCLRKHVQSSEYPGLDSYPSIKAESTTDNSSLSAFQTLAENCGFKVIREDCEYNSDGYTGSDCTEVTSSQTTNCPRRWSTESWDPEKTFKKDYRDSTAASKQSGKMMTLEKTKHQSIAPQTYIVSRNCGNAAEPKVDYLDMTDLGGGADSCRPYKIYTQKGSFIDSHSSVGQTSVQYRIKHDKQKHVGNNHKRKARCKIIKSDLANAKNRYRNKRDKVLSARKTNNKSARPHCQKFHAFGNSGKYHPEIVNLPSMCGKCTNSRLERKYGENITGKSEDRRQGQKHSNNCCTINERLTENVPPDVSDNCLPKDTGRPSEGEQVGTEVFSNINSSCLNQGRGLKNNVYCPSKNVETGMLSYMRKQREDSNRESRGRLKDWPKSSQASVTRSASFSSISKSIKPEVAEKRCRVANKEKEILNLSTKHTPGYKPQPSVFGRLRFRQKTSPGKETADKTRCNIGNTVSRRERSVVNSSQSKGTSKIPESTVTQKGVHSADVASDENDCNINFNSDGPCCDENGGANSFIGHYLYELWRNQCLCDVRLQVGGSTFMAHKIVLAAFSDIFCPENPHDVPSMCLDLPDVSEEAISLILQYLYTSEMEITDNILEAVYTAACVLEITEILDLVKEILSKPTVENFERYMAIRQNVGLPTDLMKDFRQFIRQNLLDIADSPYILNMEVEDLIQLLKDPEVMIESEQDIVKLIIRWIKFNPCQRAKYAATLLNLVNFECIGPEALSDIVEENRHLFDLASMDVFMRAFKNIAMKCKDFIVAPECVPQGKGYRQPMDAQEYREDDVCGDDPDLRKSQRLSRIGSVMPSQDARKSMPRLCSGAGRNDSFVRRRKSNFVGDDDDRRFSLSSRHEQNFNSPSAEIRYTVRAKKPLGDACNNFPTDHHETSSSGKSDSRCGQYSRNSTSRSDSETDQCTPSFVYSCTQDGPVMRKRTLPMRSGNNAYHSPECSNVNRGRDVRGVCWLNNCQTCPRSQSSSRSSGSNHRYNASSNSIKRVSFS